MILLGYLTMKIYRKRGTDNSLTACIVYRKTSDTIRTLHHVQFLTVVNESKTTTLADENHQFRCNSGSVASNQIYTGRCRKAIEVETNLN